MSLTYEEREQLADTARRIQRVREIAAKMQHTVGRLPERICA